MHIIIKKPAYEYDESSIGDRLKPRHVILEALEALGATLNFIEIRFKMLDENYDAKCVAYSTSMKEMSKQISTMVTRPLSPRQIIQNIMTEIGGGWYMKKNTKVLLPLRIPKLIKNHKRRRIKSFKNMWI